MTITARTYVNTTRQFSPSLARKIIKGIDSTKEPAVFWTGKQFLWLSESESSSYRMTLGNPNLHSNNFDGFFVEEFYADDTKRELQDFFASIIPEGSIVTYPAFTNLNLPLDPKTGDSNKTIDIFENDTLIAMYQDRICHSGIGEIEMKKLLPQIFSNPEYIKIQENSTGIFLASFI